MVQRIRLMFEWTLAFFFDPPLSKLDVRTEREMLIRYVAAKPLATEGSVAGEPDHQ